MLAYLNQLPICLVHLVEDAGRVSHKVPDGVHVVEGHQQHILGPWTEKDLVFEGHGH